MSQEESKPVNTNGNDSELEIIATSRSLGLYPMVKNYSSFLEGEQTNQKKYSDPFE